MSVTDAHTEIVHATGAKIELIYTNGFIIWHHFCVGKKSPDGTEFSPTVRLIGVPTWEQYRNSKASFTTRLIWDDAMTNESMQSCTLGYLFIGHCDSGWETFNDPSLDNDSTFSLLLVNQQKKKTFIHHQKGRQSSFNFAREEPSLRDWEQRDLFWTGWLNRNNSLLVSLGPWLH